ncbi:unnamed protein product [Chironomus riparius]|uniref:Uncharacterized protein n=1 Tax=Chironomus riparius TaxID=315576 RepID=A0A9N9WMX6_9DIPT|nr:unnamed protein product [Chironomus riparius]
MNKKENFSSEFKEYSEESKGKKPPSSSTFLPPTKGNIFNVPDIKIMSNRTSSSQVNQNKQTNSNKNQPRVINVNKNDSKKPQFVAGVLNAPKVCEPGYKLDSTGKPRLVYR